MANQNAIQDDDQVYALIAHSGTAGTAETQRVVADSTGAVMVNIGGTEPIELVAGTITSVANLVKGTITALAKGTISAGTIDSLPNIPGGTLGSILGVGGTIQVSGASAGTFNNIVTGTQQTLGTVGTIIGVGGTVVVSGASAGTYVNISTGSQQTLGTVGTVLGIGGTVQVSGASAGTNVNIVTGTLQSSGTTTGVGVVSMLSAGTITTLPGIPSGTITTGSLSNLAMLHAGTIAKVGTIPGVGVVTSITNLAGGTIGSVLGVGGTTKAILQAANGIDIGNVDVASGTITLIQGGTVNTILNPLSGVVLTTAVAIGTTATAIPTSALANRKSLILYNDGTATIYLGGTGVTASGTTTRGLLVGTSDYSPPFDLGTAILYGIGATVGGTAVILEVS